MGRGSARDVPGETAEFGGLAQLGLSRPPGHAGLAATSLASTCPMLAGATVEQCDEGDHVADVELKRDLRRVVLLRWTRPAPKTSSSQFGYFAEWDQGRGTSKSAIERRGSGVTGRRMAAGSIGSSVRYSASQRTERQSKPIALGTLRVSFDGLGTSQLDAGPNHRDSRFSTREPTLAASACPGTIPPRTSRTGAFRSPLCRRGNSIAIRLFAAER